MRATESQPLSDEAEVHDLAATTHRGPPAQPHPRQHRHPVSVGAVLGRPHPRPRPRAHVEVAACDDAATGAAAGRLALAPQQPLRLRPSAADATTPVTTHPNLGPAGAPAEGKFPERGRTSKGAPPRDPSTTSRGEDRPRGIVDARCRVTPNAPAPVWTPSCPLWCLQLHEFQLARQGQSHRSSAISAVRVSGDEQVPRLVRGDTRFTDSRIYRPPRRRKKPLGERSQCRGFGTARHG